MHRYSHDRTGRPNTFGTDTKPQRRRAFPSWLYLDDPPGVLCYRPIHVHCGLASPDRLGAQEVLSGAFHEVVVLDPDPCQHHAVRGVVVPQVGVKHPPVNLRYVLRGAETAEANRVLPVRGLTRKAGETQVTERAQLAFRTEPGLLSPPAVLGEAHRLPHWATVQQWQLCVS